MGAGHTSGVLELAACAGRPGLLASLGKDGSVRLWDAPKERCLATYAASASALVSLQTPDSGVEKVVEHTISWKGVWHHSRVRSRPFSRILASRNEELTCLLEASCPCHLNKVKSCTKQDKALSSTEKPVFSQN